MTHYQSNRFFSPFSSSSSLSSSFFSFSLFLITNIHLTDNLKRHSSICHEKEQKKPREKSFSPFHRSTFISLCVSSSSSSSLLSCLSTRQSSSEKTNRSNILVNTSLALSTHSLHFYSKRKYVRTDKLFSIFFVVALIKTKKTTFYHKSMEVFFFFFIVVIDLSFVYLNLFFVNYEKKKKKKRKKRK